MAATLSDVIMRRTGIGQFGPPSPKVIEQVSRLMAEECAWSENHRVTEVEALAPWFETRDAA
jgi:glycerol-3-phosphate dehydrogenase